MILSHLVDIKAKIVQKSINTIKLPCEGLFKDKYAGRSPERILCLYSVRLVSILVIRINLRIRTIYYLILELFPTSTPTVFLEGFELLLGALLRGLPVTFTVLGRIRNAF